jgi:hypothetical protein
VTTAVVVDGPGAILDRIQPFLGLGPLMQHHVVVMPYADVMDIHTGGEQHPWREPIGRSGLLRAITPAIAAELAALLRTPSVALFQVRSLGGATADVPAEATAFAHRSAQFQVNALRVRASALDEQWARSRPYLDGVYLPFETDTGPARLADVYPAATLERLRVLKRELDLGNLFRDNLNVEPAAVSPVPATHG